MTSSLRPGIAGLGIIGQRVAASLRAKGLTNAARFHWSHTARQVADVYERAAG